MALEATHLLPEAAGNPYRLGRHVHHDPRSRDYGVGVAGEVHHSVWHEHVGPVLDQGSLGSCTGNALAQCLNTRPLLRDGDGLLTEVDAVRIYSEATAIDPFEGQYPPDDTGSDGLDVCKAAKAEGLISRYEHAFGLDQVLRTLARQPVIVGTVWFESMFSPDAKGRIPVKARSGVAGGHEYLLWGLDTRYHRVWMLNSWGAGWGQAGAAYLTWSDLGRLLDDGGDCTAPVR
jgi:hypothetical protein